MRFGTRTTLFQSQIMKGLEKRTIKQKIHNFTVIYMHQLKDQLRLDSLMGSAVAGSTKGPALA